jgi:branched-chain amino acid transport system permease protein
VNLDLLPDVLAGSVVLAGTYVLIGLSWIIVFRAAHLMNFSTGEMLVLSGYLVAAFMSGGQSYWVAVALTLVVMVVLGVVLYRFLLRPFAGQPLFTPVIVTLGFAIVARGAMQIAWGPETKQIKPPFPDTAHQIVGGITLTNYELVLPAAALVLYVGLLLFLRYTKFGGQMRAAHENTLLASQSGMNVYLIFGVGFALSFAAAAVAGIANGERTLVATTAIPLGLKGLVPAMVGGLDSVGGVLVGALLVAVAESLTVLYLGAKFSDLVVFGILLVVLAARPYGLFGSREIQRV